MRVSKEKLHELIKIKLNKAGLSTSHAHGVADVLVQADLRGVHSHGAMRVEYYAERIAKGGINAKPQFQFQQTGPTTGIYNGDNGAGHVAAKHAMNHAIDMAKENGIAVVGVKHISHSGSMSYFVNQASEQNLVGISICQSDPMVVPFGGAEPYYGTNPIGFSAPGADENMMTFDMATTVQAWGKILHARSKNESIPEGWAVDENGESVTNPFDVSALLPIAGPKGYGLMMMVDVLSGVLLGLPFGKHVSSMYHDLEEGRDLGQLHIVINPAFFTDIDTFKQNISQTMQEINAVKPATGFDRVSYPGQRSAEREAEYTENGVEIVDDVYEYLVSEDIHYNAYDHKDPFAK